MQSSREDIYNAIFKLGSEILDPNDSTKGVFLTKSRKWAIWTNVPAAQQPAFFQIQRKEKPVTLGQRGMPPKYELHVDWIIYVNAGGDVNAIPSSLLNPITDALTKLFEIAPLVQTLGLPGIQEARIMDEDIVTDEGTLGTQAVIVIPIKIIAT